MNAKHCRDFELSDYLIDDSRPASDAEFQQHLENCRDCQRQFTELSAAKGWWTKTALHLSTTEQLKIPTEVVAQLANSAVTLIAGSMVAQSGPANSDRELNGGPAAGRRVSASAIDSHWHHILDPPTHPEMLGRIDQFEIEGKIGSGGMGIVLKGFDRNLNRAVAIKILAPHLACNGTARQRFAREAQAAAAVVHPNVVPIYAVKSCESRPYIVMQLVAGQSLQSLVQEKGPLNVKEIVRIGIQVADGLAAAHQQGLIHRDIKPANILIEQDVSRVMITDFGLARATDDAGATQSGWIAGTPHYMSPEQSQGENLDFRSDLFSLGGLLYFLATGREPFRGEKSFAVIQKIINESPISPLELNSDLPAMVSEVIERLLEKKPDDRFQSANAVREWLENYLAYLQQPMTVAQPQRVLTRRRRRIRTWKLTGIVCAALVLTGATIFYRWYGLPPTTPIPSAGIASVVRPIESAPSELSASHSDAAISAGVSPALPNFYEDAGYFREVAELDRQMTELESSWPTTFPWGSSQTMNFDVNDRLSDEIRELQGITQGLMEDESAENERLRRLLDERRPPDADARQPAIDEDKYEQQPFEDPSPNINQAKLDQASIRLEPMVFDAAGLRTFIE